MLGWSIQGQKQKINLYVVVKINTNLAAYSNNIQER